MNVKKTVTQSGPSCIFFSFAATGSGISGSDRIFIELARRWQRKVRIDLYLFSDGKLMCERNNLSGENIRFHVYSLGFFGKLGFAVSYFTKIIYSLFIAVIIPLEKNKKIICYSSSEFWMDSLPSFILKLRNPSMTWVASWYQTAPNPLKGFTEGERENTYRLRALAYYLVQFPIKRLIAAKADYVIVNNTKEQLRFPGHFAKNKTIVLIGAVDTETIASYKESFGPLRKKYSAVFQGRFHPQKGVVELVDVWRLVVEKMSDAELIMIGDGPLMHEVKKKVADFGLQKHVILPGYIFDGEEKYRIFAQSKVVVHPSFYDSGGMAAAEAMAFGLPCVGFDLESYSSYYPKGMVKVDAGNIKQFAEAVVSLLQDKQQADRIGKEAEEMIFSHYSWDVRAEEVYTRLI